VPNHDSGLSMHLIRILERYPEGLRVEQCLDTLTPTPPHHTVETALMRLTKRKIAQRLAPGHYALTPAFRTAFTGREETQP
jgi:hypothetical protein